MSQKSLHIRPTSSLVRKVLFDTIATNVPGASFLDLFAGTGSVGLEALRRGASSGTFVESDRAVLRVLRSNIDLAGAEASCKVFPMDAISFLKRRCDLPEFDIIFADPPYEKGYLSILVHILFHRERLPRRALVIQVSRRELLGVELPVGFPIREKKIGDTILLLAAGHAVAGAVAGRAASKVQ
ncbi:MAG TPA: RsmD family RNA methyltransferase [bacterium]|nr:RsmD family RNA methyltransferase [bacterium]